MLNTHQTLKQREKEREKKFLFQTAQFVLDILVIISAARRSWTIDDLQIKYGAEWNAKAIRNVRIHYRYYIAR